MNIILIRNSQANQANIQLSRVKLLAVAKQQAQNSLSALAMRLGQLQGHIIRLDALGQRLTDEAGLDKGEFDFENPPAQGGPSESNWRQQIGVMDFLTSLESLERQLKDRDH